MIDIEYVDGGNAVYPQGDGIKYIIHCCNDVGAWGAGFVLAINGRWVNPEAAYRLWSSNASTFKLGQIQAVQVENDISVINMIGQRGIGTDRIKIGGITRIVKPIRYEAIEECLQRVAALCVDSQSNQVIANVHAPKFGSGLAGGEWKHIEQLIESNISGHNIPVTIYNYP